MLSAVQPSLTGGVVVKASLRGAQQHAGFNSSGKLRIKHY